MRNLFKKSLTLCLVAILAFSCFAGIVSAENTFAATIAVDNQTITPGTTSVDVVLNITSPQIGINEALIEVSSDIGTINSKATLDEATAAIASIELPEGSTNYGSFYLSAKNDISGETTVLGSIATASITVTFTVDENKAFGSYPINIAVDGVRAASGNEDVIKFTYEEANISVVAPHVHEYTYTPNGNKTHNGTCACNEAPITNEACVDGDDEDTLCDKCGQELNEVVEPETFTVTFVDSDGTTVLKTEEVAPNGAATAPEVASDAENNTYFTGWDVDFSNITVDTTVTAQYTEFATRIMTYSTVFGSAIEMKFYIDDIIGDYADESITEFGILAWEEDKYDENDIDYDINYAFPVTDEDTRDTSGRYSVKVVRYAKQMVDMIYVRAYAVLDTGEVVYGSGKNGVGEQPVFGVSLADYAKKQMGKDDEAYDNLLIQLLNYGAATQNSFKYKTETLANADLTEEQKIVPEAVLDEADIKSRVGMIKDGSAGASTVEDPTNTRVKSFSLVFGEVIYAKFYYEEAETKNIKSMKILSWNQDKYAEACANGGAFLGTETEINDCTLEADGRYSGKSFGIYPKAIRETVYVRGYVEYEDGTFGYTHPYKYTPEYQALQKIGKNEDAALYHAMMAYCDAAAAKFGS